MAKTSLLKQSGTAAKFGAKVGSRLAGPIGWALLLADVVIAGGQVARRLGGESGRFIDATDAHTMWGGIDEEVGAKADARSFVEANEFFLRQIARDGRVNSEIAEIAGGVEKRSMAQRVGNDRIAREPRLDYAESVLDLIIQKFAEEQIKEVVDSFLDQLEKWYAPFALYRMATR